MNEFSIPAYSRWFFKIKSEQIETYVYLFRNLHFVNRRTWMVRGSTDDVDKSYAHTLPNGKQSSFNPSYDRNFWWIFAMLMSISSQSHESKSEFISIFFFVSTFWIVINSMFCCYQEWRLVCYGCWFLWIFVFLPVWRYILWSYRLKYMST